MGLWRLIISKALCTDTRLVPALSLLVGSHRPHSSSSGHSVFTRVTIQLPTQTPTSWIQVAPPTLYSRGCSPKKQVSYLAEAVVRGSPKKQTPCFVEAGNGVSASQLPSVTSPSTHTHSSPNFHLSTQSSMNKVIEEELTASLDYLTLCQENEKIKVSPPPISGASLCRRQTGSWPWIH